MKKHNLKRLSLESLVRLWFRLLWQKYDLGGINAGRSLRCEMLDCFLDFTPIPRLSFPLEEYSEGLEDEILRRPVCRTRRRFVKIEEIKLCTKREIAFLGLGALLALEYNVHKDTAWRDGYELERRKIRDVLRRFPVMYISRKCDIREACVAIRVRRSDLEWIESKRLLCKIK